MRFFGEKNTGSLSFVVWQSTGKSHLWKNGLVKEALCRVQVIEEFLAINCCRRTVDAFCFCAVVTKHVCWLEGSIDTKPKKHTQKSSNIYRHPLRIKETATKRHFLRHHPHLISLRCRLPPIKISIFALEIAKTHWNSVLIPSFKDMTQQQRNVCIHFRKSFHMWSI